MAQTNDTKDRPNPSGLCMCGCGEITAIAPQSDSRRGWVRGEHVLYVSGHNQRNRGNGKIVRECVFCNASFLVWPSKVEEGKGRFCSTACARSYAGNERRIDASKRFWTYVHKTPSCWLWTGAKNDYGYGVFNTGRQSTLAHRFAYEMLVGPIPQGLVIDHVLANGCTNTNCVNPAHLEAVTQVENIRRSRPRKTPQRLLTLE